MSRIASYALRKIIHGPHFVPRRKGKWHEMRTVEDFVLREWKENGTVEDSAQVLWHEIETVEDLAPQAWKENGIVKDLVRSCFVLVFTFSRSSRAFPM